jgi:hypothetical protein
VLVKANPVKTRKQQISASVEKEAIAPSSVLPVAKASIEELSVENDAPLQERYIEVTPTTARAYVNKTSGMLHDICLDTGASISLIDLAYVKRHFPLLKRETASAIQLDGIGSNTAHGWVELTLNLLGPKEEITAITAAFHIVGSIATPILLGNDVLVPEEAIINIADCTAHLRSSKTAIAIKSTKSEVFIGDITPATARTAQAFTVRASGSSTVPSTKLLSSTCI